LDSLLALGTEKGTIIIWNSIKGEIIKTIDDSKDGHTSYINDLKLIKGPFLFSCSDDGFICQWSVQTGQLIWKSKKFSKPVKKICLSTDNTLLATSTSSIKIWDLSSHQVIKKFVGHSSIISSMKFSSDGKFLITASSDRLIYIWDCSMDSNNISIQGLICDSTPSYVEFNSQVKNSSYNILVLSETNVVNLWNWNFIDSKQVKRKKTKPIKPNGTIHSKATIVSAQFLNENQIIFVTGNNNPKFQNLDFLSNNGEIIKNQELFVSSTSLIDKKPSKKSKLQNDFKPSIIGDINMPIADSHILGKSIEKQEASLQEKLEAMGLVQTVQTDKSIIPKVNSMQSVLIQALHTKNNALLETCLEVNDPVVIKNTVQLLPSNYVIPFLTFIVEKFQAKPSRFEVIAWIRMVLIHHSSYLMTVPDLIKSLSLLYVTVDSRLSAYPHLLKLSGRLDLLLSQVSHSSTAINDNHHPLAVYKEVSSDEEDHDEILEDHDENHDENHEESEIEDDTNNKEDIMDFEDD